MNYRIASRKGTGPDGWPTTVFVLEDLSGEEAPFGWWYARVGAQKVIDRLDAGKPLLPWDRSDK